MYDREAESLWQQIDGRALVGDMVGATLTPLSAPIVAFGQLRDAFPNALVLSRNTGTPIAYGGAPYTAYDAVDDRGDYRRLFDGELDPRLQFAGRVVGVRIAGKAVAYPLPLLMERRVVADVVGGSPSSCCGRPGRAPRSISRASMRAATWVRSPSSTRRSTGNGCSSRPIRTTR